MPNHLSDVNPAPFQLTCFLTGQELLGLKAEVMGLSRRCQLAEDRESAANERARLGEERASVLTMELAKSRAEV